jgi:hypothetical protein
MAREARHPGPACSRCTRPLPRNEMMRGLPMWVLLTAGQAGDNPQLLPLLDGISVRRNGPGHPRSRPGAVIADKRTRIPRPGRRCADEGSRSPTRNAPTRSPTARPRGMRRAVSHVRHNRGSNRFVVRWNKCAHPREKRGPDVGPADQQKRPDRVEGGIPARRDRPRVPRAALPRPARRAGDQGSARCRNRRESGPSNQVVRH